MVIYEHINEEAMMFGCLFWLFIAVVLWNLASDDD